MRDEQPVEPSAIYTRDGSLVPQRRRSASDDPGTARATVPAVAHALAAGPLIAATAFAATAVAAVKAAEMVSRLAWPSTWPAWSDGTRGSGQARPGGGLHVSLTHIEFRWPS